MKKLFSTVMGIVMIWCCSFAHTDAFAQDAARCVVKGAALSLSGDIGVEFFVDTDLSQIARFELDGPNGKQTVSAQDAQTVTEGDSKGLCRLSYAVDATQADEQVTLSAVGKNGGCELYKQDGKTRFDGDKATYSVRRYIDTVKADGSARKGLRALVSALDVYTKYAYAQFNGGDPKLDNMIPQLGANAIEKYKFVQEGELPQGVTVKGITLLVDTKTAFRIYFDGKPEDAVMDGKPVTAQHNEQGWYIELADIGADELSKSFTAKVGGCSMTFSALSYTYSVLASEKSKSSIHKLARAIYAYSMAADNYAVLLKDGSLIDSIELTDTDGKGVRYSFSYGGETFRTEFSVNPYNGKENWRIYNSYKIRSRIDMIIICQALIDLHKVHGRDMVSYRTAQDMADEWEIHNAAYDILPVSTYKDRAADVDLDPDDQGRTFAEFIQKIMNGG